MEDKKTEERKGYDVLKVTKHGNHVYVSSDYVEGKPLVRWLKFHVTMPRDLFFQRIKELIDDVYHFHGTSGTPFYQFVNPYSIIVGNDEKWYLLDHKSKRQADLMHTMQRRDIRENFLQQDNQYYQRSSALDDIYGLGKTLQFLLSKTETEPKLSKSQEKQLSQFISRCLNHHSKNSILNLADLSDQFKKIIPKESKMNPKKTQVVILIVAVACLAVISFKVKSFVDRNQKNIETVAEVTEYFEEADKEFEKEAVVELQNFIEELQKEIEEAETERIEEQKKCEVWEKKAKKLELESLETERNWRFESAFLLFKEGRYDMASKVFKDFGEEDYTVKRFKSVCDALWEYEMTGNIDLLKSLDSFETNGYEIEGAKLKCEYCDLILYKAINTDEMKERIKSIIIDCMSSDEWKEWAGEKVVSEVETMASELGVEL